MGSDPIFSHKWLDKLSSKIQIEKVILQDGFISLKRIMQLLFMIKTNDIFWLFKRFLRNYILQKNIQKICKVKGIKLNQVKSVNTDNFISKVQEGNVNILLSFNGVEIWNKDLLNSPSIGCINVHLGELPYFKGLSPVIHSINSGKGRVSATIHWMIPKVDGGKVISENIIQLKNKDTILKLHDRLNMGSVDLIKQSLDEIKKNNYKKFENIENKEDFIKPYRSAKFRDILKARNILKNI